MAHHFLSNAAEHPTLHPRPTMRAHRDQRIRTFTRIVYNFIRTRPSIKTDDTVWTPSALIASILLSR